MPTLNLLPLLPSQRTLVHILLYPLHLLLVFGLMLYENELPGSHRNGEVSIHEEDAEDVPISSTDIRESCASGPAASGMVKGGSAYGHHVLFGRGVARSQMQNNVEKGATINASTQTDPDATATGISCDSYSRAEIAKKAMITASTQTDEDDDIGGSSNETPSSLTTLVNTPTDQSSPVDAEDNELQDAVESQDNALEGRNGEEQMQEPSPSDEEATLEREEPREDLDQTQEEASGVTVPLEAQAHPEDDETGATQLAEAAGALQEHAAATSTPMVEEALLNTENAAHEQTRAELAQLRAEITGKDVELRRSRRRLREATASCEHLRGENTYLLTQLDEANELISGNDDLQPQLDDAYEQISNFEVANGEQSDQITSLQQQVDYLSDDVKRMVNTIQTGGKELKFFVQLGVQLYTRLNRAEELLDGALSRSDQLMCSAAQRLSVYTPVDLYFRDTMVEEEESTVQLAIEGGPADLPAMDNAETGLGYEVMTDDADLEHLVDEIFEAQHGTAVANGDVADDEAEEEIQDIEPLLSSMAPIATSSGTEPLFQTTASSVEDEGYRGEDHNANGTTRPTPGNHETNRNQTPANQPNASRPDANPQNPIFGASARIFGAQVSAYPVPNGNTDSGRFNFATATATDFNFGATTSFQAGSDSVKAGSRILGVKDQEEPKEGPSRETGTASIFGAAATVDPSSSSANNEEEKANKKKKIPSIFEAAAASSSSFGSKDEAAKKTKTTPMFDLSSLSSNNTTTAGASFDHGPKGASETPKFKFTASFDFSKPTAKDEQEKKPAPVFGAGKSNQSSFMSSGSATTFGSFGGDLVDASDAPSHPVPICFGGKGKQKEESMKEDAPPDPVPFQFKGKGKQKEEQMKKTTSAPLFTAEQMAKFDSPAPNKKAGFDRFDFGIAGASEGQPDASSRFSTSVQPAVGAEQNSVGELVRDLEGDHDSLYENEEGYEPPQKRPMTMEQTEMEPASATNSADANAGDLISSKPTQGFLGTLPAQLSDLNASPDSSLPVQSASMVATATAMPNTSTIGIDMADREQWSVEVDGGNPVGDIVAGVSRIGSMPASTPWREPEWPASLPPVRASEPERSSELSPLVTPPATATTVHKPAASTEAAVNDSGPNHGIGEQISSVIGAIEALSLGPSAPRAKMSDLNIGIPFLSADWFARRHSYMLRATVSRQVDATGEQVQSETESPTRMEESRVSEDMQQAEQELTSSETPQVETTAQPPLLALPITAPLVPPPPPGETQTQTPISSAETGQESWGRSKYGTPRDKKGGLRLWSLRSRGL